LKIGYLNLEQLAFVYAMVCTMGGISRQIMCSNLSYDARNALKCCEKVNKKYFDPNLFSDEWKNDLLTLMTRNIDSLETTVKKDPEIVKSLQAHFQETELLLRKELENIDCMRNKVENIKKSRTYDPCLSYLTNLQLKGWSSSMTGSETSDANKVDRELLELQKHIQV
jgi:hypothetical protein